MVAKGPSAGLGANTGLANDILHVSTEDTSSSLCERFAMNRYSFEVINSNLGIKDKATTLVIENALVIALPNT